MTQISRRAVLRGIAIGATSPVWLRFADPAFAAASTTPAPSNARHLLVVFLRGGNDPLRTVGPVGHAALDKLRPSVALRPGEVFALGNGYGISRSLPSFYEAWRNGQLAVVRQTGSVTLDGSHTSAARKVEAGNPDGRFATGWLGRYLDTSPATGPVRAMSFGDFMPLTLVGNDGDALSVRSVANFQFNDGYAADVAARRSGLARLANAPAAPGSALEAVVRSQRELLQMASPLRQLATATVNGGEPTSAQSAAQLFGAGVGAEIAFLGIDHFDTHVDERGRHAIALAELDKVVREFFQTAASVGVADRSAVLVVSEFGRRVYENGSAGTDHGHGTSVFVLGRGVRGGLYGPELDLTTLVDGNLPVRVDLRSVYASVLGGWLRANPAPVLGGEFPTLPLFR